MRLGALFVLAAATAAAAAATDARAVGTRTFELDSLDKLSGGDLKGVSVGSDGVVRAGWTLGNVPLPTTPGRPRRAPSRWPTAASSSARGRPRAARSSASRATSAAVLADTKESAVNALAVDRAGTVYAATTSGASTASPRARPRCSRRSPTSTACSRSSLDKAGTGLFAGTGADGKVVRVEPAGASSVYFKTDEPFVVALALAHDGAVYAGTSGKGLLYRIAVGRATPGALRLPRRRRARHRDRAPAGRSSRSPTRSRARRASPPRRPLAHNASGRSPAGPASASRIEARQGDPLALRRAAVAPSA